MDSSALATDWRRRFTSKLGQVVHHPLVDAIGEQQHFSTFLTQQFGCGVFRRRT